MANTLSLLVDRTGISICSSTFVPRSPLTHLRPFPMNLVPVNSVISLYVKAFSTNDQLSCVSVIRWYVDVSTVDGATSKLISRHIIATGALFLEAPVSGSKKPAEDGKLIFLPAGKNACLIRFMVSPGDEALYKRIAPFLDIMGKSRFYLGDVGKGVAMKLVVNMIMGSMMASFSEGKLLSEKVGLDPNVLVESSVQNNEHGTPY